MDSQRFDDLTRAFASGTSRRRVLKTLLGGAVGAALAAVPGVRRSAVAAPPCIGQLCLTSGECCGGTVCAAGTCQQAFGPCTSPPLSPCSSDDDCCATEACAEGLCAAVRGNCVLGGECLSDDACCGGEVCANGVCVAASREAGCPEGQIRCSGTCVDPLTDENNCGGCGATCGTGLTCVGGECTGLMYCATDDECPACHTCSRPKGGVPLRCMPCEDWLGPCFPCGEDGRCREMCPGCDECIVDEMGSATCRGECPACNVCDDVAGTCGPLCGACESCAVDEFGNASCLPIDCGPCGYCDATTIYCTTTCAPCEICQGDDLGNYACGYGCQPEQTCTELGCV